MIYKTQLKKTHFIDWRSTWYVW